MGACGRYKSAVTIRPYGSWPAPIGLDVVSGGVGRWFESVDAGDGRLRWTEVRSYEHGRSVVVERLANGELRDLTPPGTNARTRVHEYGGGAVWHHGGTTFFSSFDDGRLYRTDGDGAAIPITPEPAEPNALRYADGCVTADGARIYCVRERHEGGAVHNELVTFPCDGSAEPAVVAGGRDFFMSPRLDAAGERLAWVAWDHPSMPWDETGLWTARARADGSLGQPELVAGGARESVLDPRWSPDGILHYLSDRTGRWNLYRTDEAALTALDDAEIGDAVWALGKSFYAFLGDGRIACVVTRDAVERLYLLDPARGALEDAGLEWTAFDALAPADGGVVFVAWSPTTPTSIVSYDLATGRDAVVRTSLDVELAPASISRPVAIEFPTTDGATAHAFYYPPAGDGIEGPPGERPPLRVICHGGPTAHSTPRFDIEIQFFTQRGIGVVDVNYRGSTGYGRVYRELLEGRWGEIDWRDCVAAARFLAERGAVDPDRTWIEGMSAGGYVVLCALTFEPDAFAAGVSSFGISDVEELVLEIHKYESRYFHTMIGPYPEQAERYRARSPIHFVDRLERPLLLLQGAEDEIVRPSQAQAMADVLARKGVPHAYLVFDGEGHGFWRQETLRRCFEATLAFVGELFGFVPADELEPLELAGVAHGPGWDSGVSFGR
jgi:dipeptidyl aminopeptidase/acylaminoacyl peptidase